MELQQVIQIMGKVDVTEGQSPKNGKAFRIVAQRAGLFARGEDWPETFEVKVPKAVEDAGGYPPGYYVIDVARQPFSIARKYGSFMVDDFEGLWLQKVERPSWVPTLSGGASAAAPASSKLEVKA